MTLVHAPRLAAIALALSSMAAGCDDGAPKQAYAAATAAEPAPAARAPRAPEDAPRNASPEDARGAFRVVFEPASDPLHASVADTLFHSGELRRLVATLNAAIALPTDVVVRFGDGGGPLYDPRKREIAFDYRFVAETATMLARVDYAAKPSDLRAFVVQVVEFVLTHEVGHALVDLFDLPILGSEEDAVDVIATLLLLELVSDGNLVALTAADLHAIESLGQRDLGVGEFWSDHRLGLQRFAHIVCLVYGSDAERHAPLLDRHPGLRDRTGECVEGFEQQRRAWKRLFRPHLRAPGASPTPDEPGAGDRAPGAPVTRTDRPRPR